MTDRRPKLLQKLIDNPKAVSPDFVDTVLRAFGYTPRPGKGSHRVYTKPGRWPLVLPYQRPHLKRHYVTEVIKMLREDIQAEEVDDDAS